jgi:hexulose-6-phosphate isomerase
MKRREFLMSSGASAAGLALGTSGLTRDEPTSSKAAPPQDNRFKKAVKYHMIDEDQMSVVEKFQLLKDLGFDGVEIRSPNDLEEQEVIDAMEQTGLPVHGLVAGWKNLGDPDPKARADSVGEIEAALRDAEAYGASAVLVVPERVEAGIPYEGAYTHSRRELRKVVPLAEDTGVKIAIENVWNNFLLSPLEYARYIDEIDSPWVGAYFDVGNVVRYGWPEQWIRILGDRIVKLDIKEYSRDLANSEGPGAGFSAKLGEGSVDWGAVRQACAEIGFSGWGTAEVSGGDRERLADIARRMDNVLQIS